MIGLPMGSIANALAIIVGGGIGLVLGSRFPSHVRDIVFQGLGLCVLAIGMQMALKITSPLIVIFSILIGGIIGALIHLEDFLSSLGERLKKAIGSSNSAFTEGLITTSLLVCVGSMAILGAFDEGLRGDPTILYTKSVLDGFAAIAFSSTYGSGVLFAAIPLFVYQVSLTLLASQFQESFSPELINELTAVGGILILGIALNLLKVTYVRLGDLLPALVIVVILGSIFL